jgi:hypothetical protein
LGRGLSPRESGGASGDLVLILFLVIILSTLRKMRKMRRR